MRITDAMRTNQTLRNLSGLRESHAQATEEATSGLRVNRPSDDATAAALLTRLQSRLDQNTSTQKAMSQGRADLDQSESALAEASDIMKRAKELALTAANGGTSPDGRKATALEIGGLRQQLLGLANLKGSRGSLFAGSQTGTPAFDASGVYQGDGYEHNLQSGPNSEVTVSASGERAFTIAGGRDVFADLSALETAMNNNDPAAVSGYLDALDAGHQQMTRERARVGVNQNRAEQSDTLLTHTKLLLETQKATAGAADPAESLTRLVTLQQNIEQALQVARKVLDLQLMQLS